MRKAVIAVAAVLLAPPAFASENVTISTAATSNMALSQHVFTPTGPDAVLNVGDLQTALATSHIKVVTGSSGSQPGDIVVQDGVTWPANLLILNAQHSIDVLGHLNAAGTADLELKTGPGGVLTFKGGSGRTTFAGASQSLRINTTFYTLVPDLPTLAADISGNPRGDFALLDNYDASTGPIYTHTPIPTTFAGSFQGLGNSISNLTIQDSTPHEDAALFAVLINRGSIAGLNLRNVDVESSAGGSNVAGLLMQNEGLVFNDSVSGRIVQAGASSVGGLVSVNDRGTVSNSISTATVQGGTATTAGGLVGTNNGAIANSYATGNVRCGDGNAGGLVGSNNPRGTIVISLATGDVKIANGGDVGGLVGSNKGGIGNAYAEGAATGGAGANAGGFAGANLSSGQIGNTYSTGAPSGGAGATVGGFVGDDATTNGIQVSYWDTDTSGVSNGAGNTSDPQIQGLTSAQLQSGLPAGFSNAIWDNVGGFNDGFPFLLAVPFSP